MILLQQKLLIKAEKKTVSCYFHKTAFFMAYLFLQTLCACYYLMHLENYVTTREVCES